MMDAKSKDAADGKRTKSAAEAALNRGRQAGEIPRKFPQTVSCVCRGHPTDPSESGTKIDSNT
jgi:hypothetical protein